MSSQQKEEQSKYPMAVIGAIATVLVLIAIYYAGSSSHEKSGHGSAHEGHSSPIAPIGSVRVIGQKEAAAPESSHTEHENEEAPASAEHEPAAAMAAAPTATTQQSSHTEHENEESPAPAEHQPAAVAAKAAAATAQQSSHTEHENEETPAVASAKDTYNASCAMCHATGAAGAPKVGDKAAWQPRIAQGMDTLVQHALKGFAGSSGVMPPKGGSMHLSDEQIGGIVEYMASESQ